MDERDEGTGNFGDHSEESQGAMPPPRPQPRGMLDEAEVRAIRNFFSTSGGSVFFFLSAVSIFYGLSEIVGPILGTSSALRQTLPAIGTIGVYEISLFAVMLALVLRWRITHDAVSLLVLVAIFLITLGMLVSTVANDAPATVIGVGAAVVALAWTELIATRRWVRVPLMGFTLAGLAVLLAWNGLASAFLAQYIGADTNDVRSVRDVWAPAAAIPVAGALLLYLNAAAVRTGALAGEQAGGAFLRTRGMVWIFAATILCGSAVHQYAMRYVFDLPFYFVDYLPLIGIVALTAIEVMRGYGASHRWAVSAAAAVPLLALFLTLLSGSYDKTAGLGAGLLVHPAVTIAGLAALLGWTATRVRRVELAGVAAFYALAILLLVRPAHPGSGAEAVDWGLVRIALAVAAIPVLLVVRNPTLWTLACAVVAVILPQTNMFTRIVGDQISSGDIDFVSSSALFGGGTVLIYCVFGPRMPRWVAAAAAAMLCLAALTMSAREPAMVHPALIGCALAALSGVVYWRTRDALTALILAPPLLRYSYVSFSDAGAWRFMILGFLLLALGAAWSVRSGRARLQNAAELSKTQP